jgi:hypothetical protein
MTSTLITAYVGKGLAAARPASPAIAAGTIGWYYATDTGALSYYDGTWHTLSASDPSISPFLTVPANPAGIRCSAARLRRSCSATATRPPRRPAARPTTICSPRRRITPAKNTGKLCPGSTSFCNLGFTGPAGHLKAGDSQNLGEGVGVGQVGYQSGGAVKITDRQGNSFTLATLDGWTAAARVAFALDLDNALFWIRTGAGNWNNNAANNPATGVGGLDLSWAWSSATTRLIWPGMNAGNTNAQSIYLKTADFTQAVPAGFGSWSGL